MHESLRDNLQNNFVTAARDPSLVRTNTLNLNISFHMPAFLTVRRCSSAQYLFSLHKIFVEVSKLNNMVIIFLLARAKRQCPIVGELILLQRYVLSYNTFLQDVSSCLSYSTFELWRFTLKRNRPHFANKEHSVGLFFRGTKSNKLHK